MLIHITKVNTMPNNTPAYENSQRVRTLSIIIWIAMLVSFSLGLLTIQLKTWLSVVALVGLAAFCIPLLWLNNIGYTNVSSILLKLISLMVINFLVWDGNGIHDVGMLAYPVFIVISILLLSNRWEALFFTLAAIGSVVTTIYFEIHGYIHPTIHPAGFGDLVPILILFITVAIVTSVIMRNLDEDLECVKKSENELRESYELTLGAWSKVLGYRDKETEDHCCRLVDLSTQLARKFNLSEEEIVHLRRGALMHDIGKLAIPDNILLKAGPLDADERKIMERHPVYAKQMLSKISFLQPSIDIVYNHHERWDGSGYPNGLKGEQIPLAARIFAVVDQWDALRSDRPYRKAWSVEKTVAYFRDNVGILHDPKIVEVFLPLVYDGEREPATNLQMAEFFEQTS
jgi:putative nucleotidyltransferase with HDIG domain